MPCRNEIDNIKVIVRMRHNLIHGGMEVWMPVPQRMWDKRCGVILCVCTRSPLARSLAARLLARSPLDRSLACLAFAARLQNVCGAFEVRLKYVWSVFTAMQNSLRFPPLPKHSVFTYETSVAVKWRLHFTIPSLTNVLIFTCKQKGRVKWECFN